MCVCVCVLYYRRFYYYYSLIIVLFYSLGTRLCTTCSKENKKCRVIDCKEFRLPSSRSFNNCRYCKRHSDPSTRCANCKTRGLPDGSETKLCSTCLKARKCRVVDCKDQRYSGEHGRLHKYCKKHHSRNTRCARCNVKGLKGGAKTFCLDCKEKIRKEWEWYFKKFKLLITF